MPQACRERVVAAGGGWRLLLPVPLRTSADARHTSLVGLVTRRVLLARCSPSTERWVAGKASGWGRAPGARNPLPLLAERPAWAACGDTQPAMPTMRGG